MVGLGAVFLADQRHVSVQDQGERSRAEVRERLHHGMAGSELRLLADPREIAASDRLRHLFAAMAAHRRLGARPWLVLSRQAYAGMLRGRGRRDDLRRAKVFEAATRTVAAELRAAGAPGSIIWTVDWKGGEEGVDGYHLLPEWSVDTTLYPNAPARCRYGAGRNVPCRAGPRPAALRGYQRASSVRNGRASSTPSAS